jgi:D-alanyl-lipoteichoic acid acyltransferase DltB (MBOAT superfamily)
VLFHSQSFLLLFALVFFVYWFLLDRGGFGNRAKHLWLLATSYFFYMSWNVPLVSLLFLSSVVDFIAAQRIHRYRHKAWLYLSLIVNLGLLGYFKYCNFFLDSFYETGRALGWDLQPYHLDIILPLGISFYTFQTLSYTIDVYRGKYPPYESFLNFCLYVAFFPQLIAGPIVRADTFHYQLDRPRQIHWCTFYGGASRFVFGVFKKVVLANQAAAFADAAFSAPSEYSGFICLIGVYAFAFQIYFDFSGYTDMALGLLVMLGFKIPENFEHPYEAASIREFWQRWHISLSTWLKDYLYIPLGGSRGSELLTYRNLFIVFGLGGLWHGAGWNFFIWGMLHGAYLSIERMIRGPRFDRPRNPLLDGLMVVLTFHLVCLSWVFFRAETFGLAKEMLASMTDLRGFFVLEEIGLFKAQNWAIGFVLPMLVIIASRFHKVDKTLASYPLVFSIAALTLMLMLISLITGGANEFIYFQF